VSYPQYSTGGLGWAFWPSSDRYSLIPKWSEWHGISGKVAHPEEESNRYTLVAHYTGEAYFLIDVKYYDPDLEEYVVPDGTAVFEGKVSLPFGFNKTWDLTVDAVVDDVTDLWTGEVLVRVPQAVREAIGPGTVADFYVDWWPSEEPNDRTRIAYGTVVLRR
jgi:hypothetical protein